MTGKKQMNQNKLFIPTHKNIQLWFEQDLDINNRVIYLGGIIDCEDNDVSERIIKGIHILNHGLTPIKLILNSPGGDADGGHAIYDMIKASKAPVDIEVYGQAMSMGAIILQAGRKRIAHKNATIMVHDGTMAFDSTHTRDVASWSDWSKQSCQRMYNLFAKKTGKSAKYWKDKCSHDYIMTAIQARREGLVDKVITDMYRLPRR